MQPGFTVKMLMKTTGLTVSSMKSMRALLKRWASG
jgi:hypothetical protein